MSVLQHCTSIRANDGNGSLTNIAAASGQVSPSDCFQAGSGRRVWDRLLRCNSRLSAKIRHHPDRKAKSPAISKALCGRYGFQPPWVKWKTMVPVLPARTTTVTTRAQTTIVTLSNDGALTSLPQVGVKIAASWHSWSALPLRSRFKT